MMNIEIAGHHFSNVQIPILWGSRAILTDAKGRISVIDLEGEEAKLEVVGDQPAPGTKFQVTTNGYKILGDRHEPAYLFDTRSRTLTPISLSLPDIQLVSNQIRVGTNTFHNNMIAGFGVGILVGEEGIAVGAPLPPKLAKLRL